MRTKSRFVGCRFEPEQQRKLIAIADQIGEGGNMSAALRWLVAEAEVSQPTVSTDLPEREAAHA